MVALAHPARAILNLPNRNGSRQMGPSYYRYGATSKVPKRKPQRNTRLCCGLGFLKSRVAEDRGGQSHLVRNDRVDTEDRLIKQISVTRCGSGVCGSG